MKIRISIDAMGGDNAPEHAIEASIKALHINNFLFISLYGNETLIMEKINKLFKSKYNKIKERLEIVHTEKYIKSDDNTRKIKDSKGTSMRMAIESVKEQYSDASISCGNTGILMALSKIILRPMNQIERPAIVSQFPTANGKSTVLDLGANLECSPAQLKEFAIMGYAYAKALNHDLIFNPKIGLANIGTENIKGHEYIKKADQLMRESILSESYIGYIEPNQIPFGAADIVVCDGYTGNIIIKTAEGTAKMMRQKMKQSILQCGLVGKIAGLIVKKNIKKTFETMNPKKYNNGFFIGLNGISIKSHGNSDAEALFNSIEITIKLINENVNNKIIEYLKF